MAGQNPERQPYRFEVENTRDSIGEAKHRPRDRAQTEREVLLQRLGVTQAQRPAVAPLEDLLLRYCVEVPLNIEWYEAARRKAFQRLSLFNTIIVVLALAALAITVVLMFNPKFQGQSFSLAQLSVAVAVVVGALQVLAASSDNKARMGIFWKAASDLKEQLYSFEETWRGKVAVGGRLAPDFETMVKLELKAARKITRDERTEFFATFKSTKELLEVATSALESARGHHPESHHVGSDGGLEEKVLDPTSRLQRARQAISDAEASVHALEYRRELYERLAKDGSAAITAQLLSDSELELVAARAERRRAESLLQAILRDDRPEAAASPP